MRNLFKRLISAVVAVCISVTAFISVIPASAADSDTNVDKYVLQEKMLKDLGIINFDIEDPEATVSRGQFVDMAMRTYYNELPTYSKASTFTDVIPNYQFKDAIETACANNFVQGFGDNIFGVDSMITSKAAVVIMLRILNYEEYIKTLGAYDDNYVKVADEIELLDNLDMSKEAFNFKDVAQLLCNAIEIAPLKVSGSKGNIVTYEKTDNSTLIYERRGIDQTEGILTESFYASLDGNTVSGKSEVKISNEIYDAGTSGAEDYIGYNVHIYYDKDTKMIYHIEDDDTKVTELTHLDTVSYDNGVVRYAKNNGQSKSVKVGNDAIVIYNGMLVRGGQFDEALFDIDAGTIKVIEKSYNGHAVILIQSYIDMVLDRTVEDEGTYALINKFDSDKSFIINDVDNFDIRDSSGNVIKLADIPSEAVISMAMSLDKTSGKLIVNQTSNKLTQAYVVSGNSDHVTLKTYNETIHTYEENQYDYSNEFKLLNEENGIVKPSSEYSAYINVFGRIAYMSNDKDVSDFYAYIVKVYPATESPDSKLELRLFQLDGTTKEYTLKDNAVIDGVKCKKKSNDEIIEMLIGTDPEEDPAKNKKSRIAYVSLTYDSEIKSIDTCLEDTVEREDDYSLYKSQREAEDTLYKIDKGGAAYASNIESRARYSSSTRSFDSGILMSTSPIILAIPRDSTDTRRFKVITTASLYNDRSYEVKAYSRNDDEIAPDVVIYYYWSRYSADPAEAEPVSSTNTDTKFARLPFERTYDSETGICTECIETVNPETDDIEMAVTITNVRSGTTTVFYTDDEELTEGIEPGQIVRFATMGGDLCYLEKLYDIKEHKFNSENIRIMKWGAGDKALIPSYYLDAEDSEGNATYLLDSYSGTKPTYPVTYSIARAKLMSVTSANLSFVTYADYQNGNVTENYWKKYMHSSLKLFSFNERDNSLETKSLNDLVAYDESTLLSSEVVVITKNQQAIGVVIY